MTDDLVVTLRRGELLELMETAVAKALAAREPKPEPANDGHRRRVRVSDLVSLFGRSSSTVVTRIICHPTFPEPCQTTGTVCRHKLWWEDECLAWSKENPNLMPPKRRSFRHLKKA